MKIHFPATLKITRKDGSTFEGPFNAADDDHFSMVVVRPFNLEDCAEAKLVLEDGTELNAMTMPTDYLNAHSSEELPTDK